MIKVICQYKNHAVRGVGLKDGMHSYCDREHGIPRPIQICDVCLFWHVRKFHPGCGIEMLLLEDHPDWQLKLPVPVPGEIVEANYER